MKKTKSTFKKEPPARNFGEILHTLNRPRAKTKYIFQQDLDEESFAFFRKIEMKTGKETECSLMLKKDIPDWITWLGNNGWKELES